MESIPSRIERLIEQREPRTVVQRREDAIALTALLLEWGEALETPHERRMQARLAAMMDDVPGKAFTASLTDQCFRSKASWRVADQMRFLMHRLGIPHFLSPGERLSFLVFNGLSRLVPWLLVPGVKWLLRHETEHIILPGEEKSLTKHLQNRRQEHLRVNLNHLGEAILGEEEAAHRLAMYLDDLMHPDVDYISVKASTLFSQINLIAWEDTVETLATRLRQLYRAAGSIHPQKFVNLDMEEYSDLHLTVEIFQRVLSEPEFLHLSAGIVLQAYIPDSFTVQKQLTQWALERVKGGGAPIKIRIVKGANLAMERVMAALHGWAQAPFISKHEVDANFKRMVTFGMNPRHAHAVHLGIGSHNLFDIAFALLLRSEKHLESSVVFEMLEGMADPLRRVVQKTAGGMLLYCPAARQEEFQSAVAYLMRRLDENTAPNNFLRHVFGLKVGTPVWNDQSERFRSACDAIDLVSEEPRRRQSRLLEPIQPAFDADFSNEPDTDWSLQANRDWLQALVQEDISICQKLSWLEVDERIEASSKAAIKWAEAAPEERAKVLWQVAQAFRRRRGQLLLAMNRWGRKSVQEADVEIQEAIDFIEYYRRELLRVHRFKEVKWLPRGVVLIASPWNFPCSIPVGGVSAALLAGNGVLFKPAPEAVEIGQLIADIFWEGGVPRDLLNFIVCDDEPVGSVVVRDPRVQAVILTGSTNTAHHLLNLRPDLELFAETGGKNAIVVTRMADRDLAAREVVHSAFGYSGQKCSACSLLICEAEVYDDPKFRQQLRDAAVSLAVGQASDLKTRVAPLMRPPGPELKRALTTLEPGQEWLLEPQQKADEPLLWSPGIKLGVQAESFMHQTELFGPVLGVMRAKNLDEAIELVNGTPYGLTSGLFSLDEREQQRWAEAMQAGNLYINRGITGAVVRRQPFGGLKDSSFGPGAKAGGPNYIMQLMVPMEEENASWEASYRFAWEEEFSQRHDPSQLIGQDNFFYYKPRKSTLRVQAQDQRSTVWQACAAAGICGAPLTVSIDANDYLAFHEGWQPVAGVEWVVETTPVFIERCAKGDRVRFLSPSPLADRALLISRGISVVQRPVSACGRIELLHYLHEVSLSIDYHRYGNLGVREQERRAPLN